VKTLEKLKNPASSTNFMDEKDKLILFELLQDCRQPLSRIAKAVKLPQQTVSYRIKKLEDEKVIKKYTVNINYPKLGYSRHSLYLDLKYVSTEEVEQYLKAITDIKEVSCCYMLREVSEWRIYLSVWTKTIERYDEIQTKIITRFKKHLKNYISFQSVKSYTYFGRVLNPNKKAQCDIKGNPENFELKEMEWKIIDILRKDSRTPVVKLARELKTTTNTIVKKLKFLFENDIIERCYPTIDMKKTGYKGYIYITRLDPSYSKQIEEFIEYANNDPRFDFFIKAVGYVNLYYSFLVKDEAEFVEVVSKIDKIIGDATLKTYKIEVEGQMIS